MIPTRLHGAIDYGVAALCGGLAAKPGLPPAARAVLGAAGAWRAGYAAMTDYEAGLRPRLTMRQHLVLDVAGGVALCAAGAAMRRQPPGARALLVAAGLAELAVAARSGRQPGSGPGRGVGLVPRVLGLDVSPNGVGYPPLDVPKQVTNDLYIVDSLMSGPLGRVLGVRMTVIRLADGGLLLHSPTRYTPGLHRALLRLGPVRHLVAPNLVHWMFLSGWQKAFPDATTWGPPGLRDRPTVRNQGVRIDHELQDAAPRAWGRGLAMVPVPGGLGFRELALFHQPSRTLVLTDLVLNLERRKVPLLLRPIVRLFGAMAPDAMPPPYVRAVFRMRHAEAAAAAERMVALDPARVVFAHGRWFQQDGARSLRWALRWLLP